MEDIQGTHKTPALCQQLLGMPRMPSCQALCSRNLLSTQSQTGADQRYWGQCHPMSSFAPDFSVSVPVSNILPHSSMSYGNNSVISLFLYPNCIFYMASSTQKPCKNPADHVPEFGVWKMFTLRKATEQLFSSPEKMPTACCPRVRPCAG